LLEINIFGEHFFKKFFKTKPHRPIFEDDKEDEEELCESK
jgi:hypothetical protein